MRQIEGNSRVKAGFYWNRADWEIVTISGTGGVLPGDKATRYLRVPLLAMLVLPPLMGGLYVLFLPFLGFAMLFSYVGRKVFKGVRAAADDVAESLGPAWRPGEAHLAPRPEKEGEPARPEAKAAEEPKKDAGEPRKDGDVEG